MIHNSQQYPDVFISVRVDLQSGKRSHATLNALIPDNHTFPKGLSLKISCRGQIMSVRVSGKSVKIETVVSTLDEILEHISVCQKVMPK